MKRIIPFLLLYASPVMGQCYSTPWHDASLFSTDNSIGVYNFSQPGNSQTSNNARASAASLISILTGTTHYLKASGFGFTIPSYASICGITVEIEARATGLLLTASVRDHEVRIVKGGAITGSNHALAGDWGSADVYTSYGGSSDLWGITLTPADVNSNDFGVAISARITALVAALPDAEIDHIRMKIDYNPTLPVTFEYFRLRSTGEDVKLEWKTSEEEDHAKLFLQRSQQNQPFETIAEYVMSGSHSGRVYTYIDNPRETSLYRLKTVYLGGKTEYSAIRRFMITGRARSTIYDLSGRRLPGIPSTGIYTDGRSLFFTVRN